MYAPLGMPLPGETPEVRAVRELSEGVVRRCMELTESPGEATVDHLVGLAALVAELKRIEPLAKRCSWVLQPLYAYDPEDPGVELTRAARARGVETQLITRPSTVRTHPLLSSIFPATLLGPVFLRAMLVDERYAIIGGPDDLEGNRTSWYTDDRATVSAVAELWHATVPLCAPILPLGARPPLTERQLDVARLLCVGEKDTVIARQLTLSPRTVEREVSAILAALGAGSRAEAVLLMRGRGVNGGWLGEEPRQSTRRRSSR